MVDVAETPLWQVLDQRPCNDLAAYQATGGGRGLEASQRLGAAAVIEEVSAAGLRGRGGGGFPTGRKWATVAGSRSAQAATTVVVNGAEGEPGTFKDRALLRRNPYKVLEGALIAAFAVGASQVVVGVKASYAREYRRLAQAMAEVEAAGWAEGLTLSICAGPDSYLFGEETGLLEVMEGRQPFPRVTPPYRRGLDVLDSGRGAAGTDLAGPGGTDEAPALVGNVETLANVPAIVAQGADWFRQLGTEGSPGTIICTLVGDVRRHGIAEVPMGTSLATMIQIIGRGARTGRELVALLPGAANPLIPADLFDTPMTYEDLQAAGSGLGSAGFTAFDNQTDPVAVAQGVARFLAVESCGQCEPCKRDGLALASQLDAIRRSDANAADLVAVNEHLRTVADGARCYLATQQERVVSSVLRLYPDLVAAHLDGSLAGTDPVLIAPIAELSSGRARLDERHIRKQPDWSYDEEDSGAWPAAALGNTALKVAPPTRGRDETGSDAAEDDGEAEPPVLESLRRSHRRLQALLARATAPDAAQQVRNDAVSSLDAELRLHYDVTQRVLYPMLGRVAGEDGEDVAGAAEGNQLALIQHLERLMGGQRHEHRPPSGGAGTISADQVAMLANELQERLDDDERRAEPLLRRHLDAQALADLDDALEEARLTSLERS